MKISDFKFAEYFLRTICKHHKCPFVDLPIEFDADKGGSFSDGKIVIGEWDKLGKTIFQIVSTYVHNADKITGVSLDVNPSTKTSFYNSVVAFLRDMTYSPLNIPVPEDFTSVVGKLNRNHFVWSTMRHIVCPSFDKPLKNVKIVYGKSALIDGAKFLTDKDIPSNKPDQFPFVYCNLEIENTPAREAFLLYEIIRAHEMDPRGILHDVFTKQELWNKFIESARISYNTNDAINDFLTTLSILSDEMGSIEKRLIKKNATWNAKNGIHRESQFFGNSTWWYMGLLEKLLEPARGPDWSGYEIMKPFTDELWEKVEKEKKKRGLKELPMELLLRVQSEEFKQQPDLIIQGLLADNRIW